VLCLGGALAAVLLASPSSDAPSEPLVAPPRPPSEADAPPEPAEPASEGRLAVGLSERNASLLWADGAARVDPGLEPYRALVSRLRPAYYRLAVDWAQLQPSPGRPADLAKPDDGCLRGIAPCGAYAGIRDQLRAVASQQRAVRVGAPDTPDASGSAGAWEVVVVLYGVPDWAAAAPSGCERPGTQARSRPVSDTGLRGYRRLVRDLDALARAEGVALRWWAPWNEPNQPFFVSPQRARCSTDAAPLAPAVYARLVRAARDELRTLGGDRRLVLGELAGFDGPRPQGAGIAEFVAALPEDVACAGAVWSQHAYAEPGAADRGGPVGQLQRALDRRACTRDAPIWVTETGVGGARTGEERDTSPRALRRGCRILNALLRRWYRDKSVDAAFQYTVREDTAFPVGLADAALTRAYPTFDLWRAWAGGRAPDAPAPEAPCAG
jgi:hypothetical protein